MDKNYDFFITSEKVSFDNYFEVKLMELQNDEESEYGKLFKEMDQLLDDYPNVRTIVEGGTVACLTTEEINVVSQIYRMRLKEIVLLEREFFLMGIENAVYFFDKLKQKSNNE